MAINNSINPVKTVLKSDDSKRPDKSFTAATTMPLKDNAARAVWHREVSVKIQSLDQIRAERAPIIINEPMDSPKVWKVEANETGKIILERMQADIREQKLKTHTLNNNGFHDKSHAPVRAISEDKVIRKVRIEAEIARVKIPVEFRRNSYPVTEILPEKDAIRPEWKMANATEPTNRKNKLSSSFKLASIALYVPPSSNPSIDL